MRYVLKFVLNLGERFPDTIASLYDAPLIPSVGHDVCLYGEHLKIIKYTVKSVQWELLRDDATFILVGIEEKDKVIEDQQDRQIRP